MNIYRLEAIIENRVVHIVVVSEDEEAAFKQAEIEIERQYLKIPEVKELSLYEKRKINSGAGFVLSKEETII